MLCALRAGLNAWHLPLLLASACITAVAAAVALRSVVYGSLAARPSTANEPCRGAPYCTNQAGLRKTCVVKLGVSCSVQLLKHSLVARGSSEINKLIKQRRWCPVTWLQIAKTHRASVPAYRTPPAVCVQCTHLQVERQIRQNTLHVGQACIAMDMQNHTLPKKRLLD